MCFGATNGRQEPGEMAKSKSLTTKCHEQSTSRLWHGPLNQKVHTRSFFSIRNFEHLGLYTRSSLETQLQETLIYLATSLEKHTLRRLFFISIRFDNVSQPLGVIC